MRNHEGTVRSSGSGEPKASALGPGQLTSTSRFRPAEYLAVVNTSVVLVPGFEMFVDSFHDISDISACSLNVDDTSVIEI
jgi:hypothetical protein